MIARLRAALQTNKIIQYIAIQSRIKSIPKQKIPITSTLLSSQYFHPFCHPPHLPPVHDPQTRNTHETAAPPPSVPKPKHQRRPQSIPCVLSLRWTSPLGSQTGVVAGRGSVANVCGRWMSVVCFFSSFLRSSRFSRTVVVVLSSC